MLSKLALNRDDVTALLKGLIITMLAAGLTFLSDAVTKMSVNPDQLVLMTILALVVNFLRKVFDGAMPKINIVTDKPLVTPATK